MTRTIRCCLLLLAGWLVPFAVSAQSVLRLPGDVAPSRPAAEPTEPPTLEVVGDGVLDVQDVLVVLRAAVGLERIAWTLREEKLPVRQSTLRLRYPAPLAPVHRSSRPRLLLLAEGGVPVVAIDVEPYEPDQDFAAWLSAKVSDEVVAETREFGARTYTTWDDDSFLDSTIFASELDDRHVLIVSTPTRPFEGSSFVDEVLASVEWTP